MSWSFDWHDDWPDSNSENLERAWQAAWENRPTSNVFQQPCLSRIWVQTVARFRGEHPVLLIARDGIHTIYFPFTVKTQTGRRLWRRELRALGGDLVFDYQDPLVDGPEMDASEWSAFWSELYEDSKSMDVDLVCIPHIPASAVSNGGAQLFPPTIQCDTSMVAPIVDLRGLRGLKELLARVSPNHRSKMRRKLRAVSARNPRLVIFARDDVAGALQMFDAMQIAYDKQHGGNGLNHIFLDRRNVEFYRAMIRVGLPAGWLHVSTLEVGGATVSWHIGFFWKHRFYWYKPCYGVDEEKVMPGHLHIAYLLMHGLTSGWEIFDFTVGSARYKRSWATNALPIYRLSWYPSNLRGHLNYLAHSAARVVRKHQHIPILNIGGRRQIRN